MKTILELMINFEISIGVKLEKDVFEWLIFNMGTLTVSFRDQAPLVIYVTGIRRTSRILKDVTAVKAFDTQRATTK